MADTLDVVARSFNINNKLGPKLEAAAEQNAILRIGWTNAGDPVPKNGELGLCPGIPKGAKIRALGTLGSWTAAFGKGGVFTIQGDVGSFWELPIMVTKSHVKDPLEIMRASQCPQVKYQF